MHMGNEFADKYTVTVISGLMIDRTIPRDYLRFSCTVTRNRKS